MPYNPCYQPRSLPIVMRLLEQYNYRQTMTPLFKPIYLPQNSEAQALIEELADEVGLMLKGKAESKHKAILA